jgi:hypothetical protein
MNDLDLLKDFRAGLAAEARERDSLDASWERLRQRIQVVPGPIAPARRGHRRRWPVVVAVAATVAALLFALPALLPSNAPGGAHRAAAAVAFRTQGRYIVAVIKDPVADGEELKAEFAEHGLDISLQLLPVSPSFVGKFVFEGDSGTEGGPAIETLYDPDAACTTPGGSQCPIGLRIPLDFQGHADLGLGRAAEPGEEYVSANDAFAPGEALHDSGLRGMTVHDALRVLDGLGVRAIWRSNDASIDRGVDGIDPSTIADQHVADAVPYSAGVLMIWASPGQPEEPGAPQATASPN